ncbi:hypothetical protein IJM16_02980 [Candidatus Saccharibacteria bacterium]|nr:hypothetical protein [Candidatus Saccharibacteria bacterium]
MGKRKVNKFQHKLKNLFETFVDRCKFAVVGFKYLLTRRRYVIALVISILVFLYILSQLQNNGANWQLLWSGLDFGSKMQVLGRSFRSMLDNFTSFQGILIVLLALMQALCVAGIVFAIRHRQKDDAINGASAGSIASILAFVTLGCPTCGMTLLTPLLTMIAGTSAVALAEKLGIVLSIVAFVLLFATLVHLGYLIFVNVSAERAKEKHAKSN